MLEYFSYLDFTDENFFKVCIYFIVKASEFNNSLYLDLTTIEREKWRSISDR